MTFKFWGQSPCSSYCHSLYSHVDFVAYTETKTHKNADIWAPYKRLNTDININSNYYYYYCCLK
jgi:hypothetical protein